MDFGDISDDASIQEKLLNFHSSVEKIGKILELSADPNIYQKLTTKEKVDYDLFMAYTLNTLYWLYLRTKGEDPNKNDIKNQLNRIKQYMVKAKQAHERQTIRPKLDQPAARRFIKHGLQYRDAAEIEEPPHKKLKLSN
ncbi:nuclear nucleic acid-binding protein C1D [Asbolus verrucosus]|uniref:Nuclear nucleic acid-binding protein C1D n=1 Tax=Asbolus verrucosus TaxID=1661398 RepID=A0A482VYP9_ASBVE|nr:nuclear nucleic acid-binding protein C1D [Asbolus verrucosus]